MKFTKSLIQAVALALFSVYVLQGAEPAGSAPGASGSTTNQTGETKAYVLTPNDVVEVTVYQETDLSTRATITKEGTITLPLLGPVHVGGQTAEQASTAIRGLLAKDILVNPKVHIAVVEYSGRRFTILGEVRSPGTYKMSGAESMNLLDAIATAGGYTRIGSPKKITVQRTVNGEQRIFKLDASAMAKDKDSSPFEILPGDTISVGEKIF